MNKLVLIAAVLALGSLPGQAQFRKYSNEFLNIGAGARSLGMGGAGITTTADATAGYWNPARLAAIQNNPQLTLMHAEYFSGIGKYDFAGLAVPTADGRRTLGFSLMRFGIDDIPNTLFLVEPDGRPNYNNIETFSSADYAFMFGMSQHLLQSDDKDIAVGGNIKVIHRNIGSFAKAWGFGFDFGFNMRSENWSVAAVLRDGTTTFNMWNFRFTEREKQALYLAQNDIPQQSSEITAPRLLLGAAHRFYLNEKTNLLAELQLDNTFDGRRNTLVSTKFISIDPRLGLELNVADVFSVRGGVSNFQQALKDGDTTNKKKVWIFQPSLGAGFKIKNVKIDYAFTNLANQSSPLYTHIVSLSIDLKRKEE